MKDKTLKFIEKASITHNNRYDYSKSRYKTNQEKLIIICKEHGEFLQSPANHLRGSNCPKCVGKYKPNNEEFKLELSKIHNYYYDYSLVKYTSRHSMIDIICPKHGVFKQKANDHYRGHGCMKCGRDSVKKIFADTAESFTEKARKIHGNLYDYSKLNYINNKNKVEIKCRKHGVFEQSPRNHILGNQCPKCALNKTVSKAEKEIAQYLRSLGYAVLTSDRKAIYPYELDIYIPTLNKAIEFNGEYWHYSEKYFEAGKHAKKSNLCKEKNIKLLHIREDLWMKDKEKMKQIIKVFLDI